MPETCIVVPCYNEANRLNEDSFLSYTRQNPCIHFLFVDDGSTDSTTEVLKRLIAQNPTQIKFRTRNENLGKAQSVREGVLNALSWKPFDFIGYFDADLATPLEQSELLLNEFAQDPGLQMVFGSRMKTESNLIKRNIFRHHLGRFYSGLVTSIMGLKVYDTQCGAKMFRAGITNSLFSAPFSDRWLFDVEIFCRLKKLQPPGGKVIFKELPLTEWSEKGHSRIRLMDIVTLPVKTARIFFRYR